MRHLGVCKRKMNIMLLERLSEYIASELSSATKHKYTARTMVKVLKSQPLHDVLASKFDFVDEMTVTERAAFVAGMEVDEKMYLIQTILQYMI